MNCVPCSQGDTYYEELSLQASLSSIAKSISPTNRTIVSPADGKRSAILATPKVLQCDFDVLSFVHLFHDAALLSEQYLLWMHGDARVGIYNVVSGNADCDARVPSGEMPTAFRQELCTVDRVTRIRT